MALFSSDDMPVTVVFDYAALNIARWDFESGHRYNLVGKVIGEQRGNLLLKNERVEFAGSDHPQLRAESFHLDDLPSNGSRVRFTGVVQGVPIKHKGDWAVTLLQTDAEPGQEVRVICKNVGLHWPKLDLRSDDEISVVGMYQGRNPDTEAPEIVVSERNHLSFITPTRAGRNWLPLVVALAGILLLSSLWVTLLRRAVRQRTKDVRDSEAKLMTVYQSVPQGIVAVDPEQKIFGINRAFYNLFQLEGNLDGSTFSELRARIRERIVDTERWDRFLQRVTEQGRGQTEQTVRTKEVGEGPQQIGIQVESIDREEAGGQIWLFRDLTETRELESSLAQSRKLEAVGRLTGGIAHDFNNILTGVTGNLSMLEYELDDPPLLEYVHGASDAAQHAAELVRRLLDYTKQTRLEVKVSSVNDILTKLYEIFRHSVDSRIRIDMRLGEDLQLTKVDPVKIEQVLMNLVLNAIDAMPNGGELLISTQNSWSLDDPEAASVTIAISDNGTGIAPELIDKIFEPYFTTKSEDGNGLGLPTSRGIIEQHEGKLLCCSTQGKGTTFRVVLPATQDRPENRSPALSTTPVTTESPPTSQPVGLERKLNVVVIDDENSVRKMIQHMLVRSGFEVVSFPNGREALDYIEQNPTGIDLVVSDNSMPVMDGIETFEQVRGNYPSIPFIVASGYLIDLEDYAERANGSPPEAFIQKPLKLKGFIAIVNNPCACRTPSSFAAAACSPCRLHAATRRARLWRPASRVG